MPVVFANILQPLIDPLHEVLLFFHGLVDSWGLVILALVYLSFCGWAFLPRNRKRNRDAANIIFKDESDGD